MKAEFFALEGMLLSQTGMCVWFLLLAEFLQNNGFNNTQYLAFYLHETKKKEKKTTTNSQKLRKLFLDFFVLHPLFDLFTFI